VCDFVKAKPSTIYLWAEQGAIPCFKLNGLLRFSEDDILSWVKECKKQPLERYNTSTVGGPGKEGSYKWACIRERVVITG